MRYSLALSKRIFVLLCLLCAELPALAQTDLDAYTVRITGLWWRFKPTGTVGATAFGTFDLRQDFGFQESSTFIGNLDWKFARKHHVLFEGTYTDIMRSTVLARTITFQGVTYNVGANTHAQIDWTSLAPGYQYDIVRRDQGYFGLAAQVYIIDPKATLTGTATLNGQSATRTASTSATVGLPVIGPRFRVYPIPGSGRLAIDGFAQGMYYGQYGHFWTARGTVLVGIVDHLKISAGYQWGTRLKLRGGANDLGATLSESGPVAGIEVSF